jgi:hypothetical protein
MQIEIPLALPGGVRAPTRDSLLELAAWEPFRLFFPQAVLAGIVGVLLWPLYFWHFTEFYPGLGHIRIMAFGFFGGFIFGFLGTALPRMLSARPFEIYEVALLLLLHGAMVISFALERIFVGDSPAVGSARSLFLVRSPKVSKPEGHALAGFCARSPCFHFGIHRDGSGHCSALQRGTGAVLD